MLGMLPLGARKRPELYVIRFAGALVGKLGHYRDGELAYRSPQTATKPM